MEMEQFFTVLSEICLKVLPVVGVILLIYLVIFVHKLVQLLTELMKTAQTATQTIHEVEIQVRKLDGPLQTAVELSETVSKVHKASENAVKQFIVMAAENFNAIKEYILALLHKDKKTDQATEEQEQPVEELKQDETASAE